MRSCRDSGPIPPNPNCLVVIGVMILIVFTQTVVG